MTKRILIVGLLVLVCLGLTAKKKATAQAVQPEWISNPYAQYSMDLYLCGVGVARDYSQAQKEAARAIAEFFETEVRAVSKTEESAYESSSSRISSSSLSNSFSSQIQTKTEARLTLSQVVETWQDAISKNIYVLMVVDKGRARAHYAQEIEDSETAIEQYLSKEGSALGRFASIFKAIENLQKTGNAYAYHNALARFSVEYLRPQYSLPILQEMQTKAASEIPFQIAASGDKTGSLTASMQKVLQELGLPYTDSSEYSIQIKLVSAEPEQMLKQYFQPCSLTITMLKDDTTFFTFRDQTKQGGNNLQESESRNIKVLSSSIQQKFPQELLSYLLLNY
ncbi:MAG: LPP20 family lipoprotein [Candidatus Cloacimonadaceae bacterium]|nr:LPP20 family lipoprotein [Candidatus Cloacimonadaceae bacterium]